MASRHEEKLRSNISSWKRGKSSTITSKFSIMEKFSSLETAEKWLDPERMRQLRRSCATNRGNPTIESNEIERKSGLSREESAVSTIYECKKKRREMLSESNVAEKRKKETRASNGVFKLDGIDRGDILRARWRSITVERNLDLDKQRRAIGKWKRETPLPSIHAEIPVSRAS